jgi:hypothetical protein
MSFLQNLTSGVRALFHKDQVEQEMDEELRSYMDATVKDKMRSGVGYEQALRAVLTFLSTPPSRVRKKVRAARGSRLPEQSKSVSYHSKRAPSCPTRGVPPTLKTSPKVELAMLVSGLSK